MTTKKRRHGNQKYTEEDVKRWRDMLRAKMSLKEVAEKEKVPYNYLMKRLRDSDY
jgi:hypothetical protein